ncbi:hypothetical protein [Vibrio fluvialis]|uniref:hypothetical protein n=1 Tax=Vibrio fluvialis TaxID=676 RepID=UPI001EE9BC26|nr:hypothetical protein [Vibrio fluvialis]MCG6412274.1 hypothetical protein [Vibrio fluvialis]
MDTVGLVSIVSAGSAIFGVVIAQGCLLWKDHTDKKHQKDIVIRTKYDEFVTLIHDTEVWCSKLLTIQSVESLSEYNVCEPQRKAKSMALIYFPEFKSELSELGLAYARYFNAHSMRLNNAKHGKKTTIDDLEIVICLSNLDSKIDKYAYKYVKA